jgi:O-antigen/teichoic acid export membrane protein
MAYELAPLAVADAVEWSTRKIDIMLLGFFASPSVVGVYYVAQQVATLPQKLKTTFEPILGPVITSALANKDYDAIARQVCQVGFWILAAQLGVALALAMPGEAVMGLLGSNFVGGTGALVLLLAAEVAAALAVVSESALVYVARIKNLWVSLATIALQVVLTIAILLVIRDTDLPEPFMGAGAAAALFIVLGIASLVKGWLLSRILNKSVNNWRWALVWAAAPAVAIGYLSTLMPEWFALLIGVPATLGIYCWVIWNRGFGPEDRKLFRKNIVSDEAPTIPGEV